MYMRKTATFLFFLGIISMPLSTHAQSAPQSGAAITASPGTVAVGQNITVSFTNGAPSADFMGTIIMSNTETGSTLIRTSMHGSSGTYPARYPGTYVFTYYLIGSVTPLATSNLVTVTSGASSTPQPPTTPIPPLSPMPSPTAPSAGAAITATPGAVTVGQNITVSFTSGAPSSDFIGTIVMMNTETGTALFRQSMYGSTGTYPAHYPGTYVFSYYVIGSVTPVANSNVVTVTAPASVTVPQPPVTSTTTTPVPGYALSVSPLVAAVNDPITVRYSGPSSFWDIFNSIILVDATGRTVFTQFIGTSDSGTIPFRIATPGTYTFKYRVASLLDSAIVAKSGPVVIEPTIRPHLN